MIEDFIGRAASSPSAEALKDGFELAGCISDLSELFLAFAANECKLS